MCECVRACVCAGKKETSKGLKRHLVARLDAALWVSIRAVRRRKLVRCSGDSVKLKLLSLTAPFFLGLKLFGGGAINNNKKKSFTNHRAGPPSVGSSCKSWRPSLFVRSAELSSVLDAWRSEGRGPRRSVLPNRSCQASPRPPCSRTSPRITPSPLEDVVEPPSPPPPLPGMKGEGAGGAGAGEVPTVGCRARDQGAEAHPHPAHHLMHKQLSFTCHPCKQGPDQRRSGRVGGWRVGGCGGGGGP